MEENEEEQALQTRIRKVEFPRRFSPLKFFSPGRNTTDAGGVFIPEMILVFSLSSLNTFRENQTSRSFLQLSYGVEDLINRSTIYLVYARK